MKKLIALFAALLTAGIVSAAVNINTATKAELEALPDVGPARAQAIIDYRAKNGPFKSAEDLKKVEGVGDKNFEGMKSKISLSGPTKIDWETQKADAPKKEMTKDAPKADAGKKEAPAAAAAAKDAPKKEAAPAKKEMTKEEKAAEAKAKKEADKKKAAEEKAKKAEEKKAKAAEAKAKKEADAKAKKDAAAKKDAPKKDDAAKKDAPTKDAAKKDEPKK
jgi:competence protein ComEA